MTMRMRRKKTLFLNICMLTFYFSTRDARTLGSKVNVLIDDVGATFKQDAVYDRESGETDIELRLFYSQEAAWKGDTLSLKDPPNSLEDIRSDVSPVCECKVVSKCIPYTDCYELAGITATLIFIFIVTLGYILQCLSLIPHERLSETNMREAKCCGFVLGSSSIVEPVHPNGK